MRTYVNKKTGTRLITPCEISGEDWVDETPITPRSSKKDKPDSAPEKTPSKK